MGRFDNILKGKGKDVTIGDEVFTIKPLDSEHLGLFMDLEGPDKAGNIIKLVYESLKKADDTIELSDVKSLPLAVLQDVLKVVIEVNELK